MSHKQIEVRFSADGSIMGRSYNQSYDVGNRHMVDADGKASYAMEQESGRGPGFREYMDYTGMWRHMTKGFDMVHKHVIRKYAIKDAAPYLGNKVNRRPTNVRIPMKEFWARDIRDAASVPNICFVIDRIESAGHPRPGLYAKNVPSPAFPQKVLDVRIGDDGYIETSLMKIDHRDYEMSHEFAEYMEGIDHNWD